MKIYYILIKKPHPNKILFFPLNRNKMSAGEDDIQTEEQQGVAREVDSEGEVLNYGKVCNLLIKGSMWVMKHVFDSVFPPMNLVTRLQRSETHKVLRRLKVSKT